MSAQPAYTGMLPAPFAVGSAKNGTITDRDGHPVLVVVHACTAPAERLRFAEEIVAALNAACGIPEAPIEAPLDPRHIGAVQETTRAFVRRVTPGPLSNAAE